MPKILANIKELIEGFENTIDIEAKIAFMIDKAHSASAFIKYQSEQDINMMAFQTKQQILSWEQQKGS